MYNCVYFVESWQLYHVGLFYWLAQQYKRTIWTLDDYSDIVLILSSGIENNEVSLWTTYYFCLQLVNVLTSLIL